MTANLTGNNAPSDTHSEQANHATTPSSLAFGLTDKIPALNYLVTSERVGWIMTGPQISGMGSGVPVSAEYQMLHEKGTRVATAVPFYWIAGQTEATA